jgi:putative hydrolase of the HAD superfamily
VTDFRYKNVRWITIDATGTLIDPFPTVGSVYRDVLKRHGIEAEAVLLQKRFIEVFRNMTCVPRGEVDADTEYAFWKKLVLNVVEPWVSGERAESVFLDAYEAFARTENWRAPGGAEEMLKNLQGRGYRLALLSNADARCRSILNGMGLSKYLEHIMLSCELGYEKPDIRIFRAAEKIMGAKPDEILHVGDSLRNDGQGPERAGWRTLVIGRDIARLADVVGVMQ